MRKLAHVERVLKIEPIENADFIEKATILGWECVTKKDELKEGDLCVYIEIDSILPDIPLFDFMRDRKFRVRTIKLKKQVSQGLALPLTSLLEFTNKTKWSEGDDVTDIMKIVKYDPQKAKEDKYRAIHKKKRNYLNEYMMSFAFYRKLRYKLGFSRMKNYPTFISKTDEERIQNMPHILNQWGDMMYCTEKLDGCSATYAVYKDDDILFTKFRKSDFFVCSRNICLYRENNTEWWRVAREFGIKEKLLKVGKNIAVQGEIVGDGIQGNKYNYGQGKLDFFVYNVIDINTRKRYNYTEKKAFCEEYGFKMFPEPERRIGLNNVTVQKLVGLSKGKSLIHPKIHREGLVIRSLEDDHKSFKVINPDFLLKYGG